MFKNCISIPSKTEIVTKVVVPESEEMHFDVGVVEPTETFF